MDFYKEYDRYKHLATWQALKIYSANTFPTYIKEDFIYVARESLIITLNKYNKQWKENPLTKPHQQKLKNRIVWDIIDKINAYVCSYVGCRTLTTQKKHKLYPSNQDDTITNKHSDNYIPPTCHIDNSDPRLPIMDNEITNNARTITQRLFKLLKITKPYQDMLFMNYNAYKAKYTTKLTYKQFDNTKLKLKNMMKQRIMKDEQYYKNLLN